MKRVMSVYSEMMIFISINNNKKYTNEIHLFFAYIAVEKKQQ